MSPGGVRCLPGGRAPGEVCLPLGADVNAFQPENKLGWSASKDRTSGSPCVPASRSASSRHYGRTNEAMCTGRALLPLMSSGVFGAHAPDSRCEISETQRYCQEEPVLDVGCRGKTSGRAARQEDGNGGHRISRRLRTTHETKFAKALGRLSRPRSLPQTARPLHDARWRSSEEHRRSRLRTERQHLRKSP